MAPCCCLDDKGEAAAEAGLRGGAAREGVRRQDGQQPAAAGGRREGPAPHRPQHRGQKLQQEEHLQPTQVKKKNPHTSHCRSSLRGTPQRHSSFWNHVGRAGKASPAVSLHHMSLLTLFSKDLHGYLDVKMTKYVVSCFFFVLFICVPIIAFHTLGSSDLRKHLTDRARK